MKTQKVTKFVELYSTLPYEPDSNKRALLKAMVKTAEDNEIDLAANPDMDDWFAHRMILSSSIWWNKQENIRILVCFVHGRPTKIGSFFISATGQNENQLSQIVNCLRQYLVEELVNETN